MPETRKDEGKRSVQLFWQTGTPFDSHNNPSSYLRKRVGDVDNMTPLPRSMWLPIEIHGDYLYQVHDNYFWVGYNCPENSYIKKTAEMQ